ncbi:hypothetical protein [Azospirillum argentinense]|uniref:hypothetical protein n=1 Tax=Azospirillum argentinense TaxID=2970906 RepID=UPI0032DF4631
MARKTEPPKRRAIEAKALRQALYRPRIKPSAKLYTRKGRSTPGGPSSLGPGFVCARMIAHSLPVAAAL